MLSLAWSASSLLKGSWQYALCLSDILRLFEVQLQIDAISGMISKFTFEGHLAVCSLSVSHFKIILSPIADWCYLWHDQQVHFWRDSSQALKFALGRCILLHTKFTCRQTSDTQIINDIKALESFRFRVLQATDKQVFSSSALLLIFPNLAVCQVKMT